MNLLDITSWVKKIYYAGANFNLSIFTIIDSVNTTTVLGFFPLLPFLPSPLSPSLASPSPSPLLPSVF